MKETNALQYLGGILAPTLGDCVHQTVINRVGLAKKSIYDIRAVVEDKRAESLGGFNLCLEIFESTVQQMLLSSSETWVSIPKKTLKILEDLYSFMYRVFFRCGTGMPKMNYYWQKDN